MEKITLEQRFARAVLVAIAGGAVAVAIITTDRAFMHEFGFVRCAVMGAFLAGFVLARGFGGEGAWAWFRSGMTFGGATVLGAVIAVPLLGVDAWLMKTDFMQLVSHAAGISVFGPVYVLGLISEQTGVFAVWTIGLIVSHALLLWAPRAA